VQWFYFRLKEDSSAAQMDTKSLLPNSTAANHPREGGLPLVVALSELLVDAKRAT
jgi:hypothetical protein